MRSALPVVPALSALLLAGGCASTPRPETAAAPLLPAQEAFWTHLRALCGNAYEGTLAEGNASDSTFRRARVVMHVRSCSPREIRIPLHVGGDRSRTWVLTRTDAGLRLKHDHRHADGSEDAVTQYGGDVRPGGTARLQSFPADAFTARLLPAAASNVWTVEVEPGRSFAYQLVRESTGRRFRVVFDLTAPVPPPPAPWGDGVPARVRG